MYTYRFPGEPSVQTVLKATTSTYNTWCYMIPCNGWLFLNFDDVCKCLKKSTVLILGKKKQLEQTLFSSIYMDGSDDSHVLSLEALSIFVSI